MQRLRVMTLNIWNRQGQWPRRLPVIRAELAALAPDVIGLQEVLDVAADGIPGQAHEIADGLGYQIAYASAWEMGGGVHFGNAILSRYPIAAAQGFSLPSPDGEETRGVGYARISTPVGEIPVFNTHLSWKLHHTHIRVAQVQAVVERVRALAPVDGLPPILMGDFNAEPDADEIRYLRGLTALGGRGVYFADCWDACRRDEPGAGAGYTFSRANPNVYATGEPSRRIDYIFVRGPDRQRRGEPVAARVVMNRPRGGVYGSDHFGVYAEIHMAPRALV